MPKKTNLEQFDEEMDGHAYGKLVIKNLSKYFLISAIILLLGFITYIISPFLVPIILAAVIASVASPMQKAFVRLFKEKQRWLAALLSTIIIIIVVLGPLSLLVSLLSSETIEAVGYIEEQLSSYDLEDMHLLPEMIRDSIVGEYLDKIEKYSPITREDIADSLASAASSLGSFLVDQTKNIAKKVSFLLVHLFVLLLSLFYFLRDGDKIIKYIQSILPMPNRYENILFKQLSTVSRAIIYGIFGAAIVQGLMAGIGYAIAGVDNSAFWGTITGFFSIVPYLGAAIVWVPITIVLFSTGHWVAGIFLVIWGVAVVSTVDNLVKPYLIGGKAHIYPLMVLFVVLGSIFTIGFKGLILGPFALILILTFLHIYKLEYKEVLDE